MITQRNNKSSYLNKLMIFSMMLFAIVANAQTVSTTEEEYNYLTKGYKIQLESGLDMKKGYKLVDLDYVYDNPYIFDFKYCIRTSSKEVCAILVIIKERSWVGQLSDYICIPFNNPYLQTKYQKSISTWEGYKQKTYTNILSKQITTFVSTINMQKIPLPHIGDSVVTK